MPYNLPTGSGSGASEEGFRAHRALAQTLAAGTLTIVIFDTEDRDEGADYNPTTGEWTVPSTGWYDLAATITFATPVETNYYAAQLFVGGVRVAYLAQQRPGGGTPSIIVAGALPVHLTAGNVVTIRAQRGDAGDIAGGSALTYFTAKRRYVP